MAEKNIEIHAFTGMNNIKSSEGLFVKKGVAQPRINLNCDVTPEGILSKRDGQTKTVALSDCHSLFGGATCMLVMSGLNLYRIEDESYTLIQGVTGPQDDMFYAEVADQVYMSNQYWNGIFDPMTNAVSDWGITLPPGPMLSSTNGNLPPGTYHVCFTSVSGSDISGNGPISQIMLSSEGGISISNRPADAIVWCTDPNGDTFYRVGEVSTIVDIPAMEPLPSLFCSPPPFLKYITHAFGRMWGARGNYLYYSEPFHLDWWRLGANRFEFATDITLIAVVKTGLFIGCEDRTYCLLGRQPEEMQQLDVGAGAIPGTLAYVNDIVELGDVISPPEKKHHSVPVWVSQEGIVAGNPLGRLFSLSQDKVRFYPGKKGAALYRKKDGNFQYLTSFYKGGEQEGIGMEDDATVTVIRNGQVI